MTRRELGHGLVLVVALSLAACTTKPEAGSASTRDAAASAADESPPTTPIPETADAFLAELLPLPEGATAIEVTYAIEGPALAGSLTTLIAPGGQRRDDWALKSTADASLTTSGFTIINASEIFTGTVPGGGKRRSNHLDALARAYLELDEDARRAVAESILAWHRTLAEQRARHGGDRGEVLGVGCLQTRVAAQNVCMWEETGLPLRYEGAAFTIAATKIDRSATASAASFEAPADVASFERVVSDQTHDYAAVLSELAEGSYAKASVLVLGAKGVPDLRVPAKDGAPVK